MINLVCGISLFLVVIAGVLVGINDIKDKSCDIDKIKNKEQLQFCTGLTYSNEDTHRLVSWYKRTTQ